MSEPKTLVLPWGVFSRFRGGHTKEGEPISMCPRCCAMVYEGLEYQFHHENWHRTQGEVLP